MSVVRPSLPAQLLRTRVLAILRGLDTDDVLARVGALAAGGIRAFEVTLDSPHALDSIRALRDRQDGLAVGAGTVMSVSDARAAIDAGAELLVSPHSDPAITIAGAEAGVAHLPGALTPTEIVLAWRAGAAAVKLFPAGADGVATVQALRGPLGGIPLVPTGGVGPEDAGRYLAAGAAAVAVGAAFTAAGLDEARMRAQALSDSCRRVEP